MWIDPMLNLLIPPIQYLLEIDRFPSSNPRNIAYLLKELWFLRSVIRVHQVVGDRAAGGEIEEI